MFVTLAVFRLLPPFTSVTLLDFPNQQLRFVGVKFWNEFWKSMVVVACAV